MASMSELARMTRDSTVGRVSVNPGVSSSPVANYVAPAYAPRNGTSAVGQSNSIGGLAPVTAMVTIIGMLVVIRVLIDKGAKLE